MLSGLSFSFFPKHVHSEISFRSINSFELLEACTHGEPIYEPQRGFVYGFRPLVEDNFQKEDICSDFLDFNYRQYRCCFS